MKPEPIKPIRNLAIGSLPFMHSPRFVFLSARPRDPPTLVQSFGGFKSAEARSAKVEGGDPDWIPACAGMGGTSSVASLTIYPVFTVSAKAELRRNSLLT